MSRTALVRAAAVAVLILQWTTRSFGQPAELTPTALLRASDVVLAASVHGIATRAGRGTRSTFVSLEVEEVYKGWIPERQIVIKDSAAAPAFRIGESVLLFLEIDPGDRVLAPIESSGKWTVTSDPRTGERIARQDATSERTVPFGRVARAIPLASLRSAIPLSLLALVGMSRVSIDVSPRIAYTAASAAAVDATVPGPPRQLAVSVASSGNFAVVNLSWLPPTTGDVPASYRVDAGSAPGLSDIATVSVAATSLRATVASGFAAFVRVYALNAAGVSPPSNEVLLVAATSPPGAPSALDGNVAHGLAELMWVAPASGRPATYVVEAGSSSGAADLGTFETNSVDTFASGYLAPRLYFFRVRARNSAGLGPPSNEISFAPPGSLNCLPPRTAPTDITASVTGSTLTLNFTPVQVGVTYVVQAGSAPAALDIATLDIGRFVPAVIGGVPPGQYYLRLFARDYQCGLGPGSTELLVTVR